jgi:hypothetical protein
MTVEQFGLALLAVLNRIADSLTKPNPATRIALGLPILTRNGTIMNFEIPNNTAPAIAIHTVDAPGDVVPAPSGDVFSAVSSDPTKMTAAIGTMPSGPMTGKVALILTPLVKLASGLTVTVTDTAALTLVVQTVDIVADLTPKAISLDIVDAVFTPQAVPASQPHRFFTGCQTINRFCKPSSGRIAI